MEVFKKSTSIGHILYWFPSTLAGTISQPIIQILELVANNLGIEDGGNLLRMSIFKFDWGWRLFITTEDKAVSADLHATFVMMKNLCMRMSKIDT